MPSYLGNNQPTSHHHNVSSATLLKSVQDQEAEFERLALELDEEKSIINSDTASMASMSTITYEDPYHSRTPQDSHFQDDSLGMKMNTNLLDSFMREFDERKAGTTNIGEENPRMDYIHEDPYSRDSAYQSSPSGYNPASSGMPYASVNYTDSSPYDGNTSPHSSHQSLQSTGSNRYSNRTVPKTLFNPDYEPRERNSMSSLRGPENNGNYAHIGRTASPHGATTPTRFTNTLMSNYNNVGGGASPRYTDSPSPSLDSREYRHQPPLEPVNHYDTIGGRDPSYPGSRNSYQAPSDHGGPAYHPPVHDDYGNYSDHIPSQSPYMDDHYRDSPVSDPYVRAGDVDRYGNETPTKIHYNDPNYADHPDLSGPEDPYFNGPGRPPYPEVEDQSNGYPGERNSYQDPHYDPYSSHDNQGEPRERNSYQSHDSSPYVTNPNYADTDLDGPDYRGPKHNAYNDMDDPRTRASYSSNKPEDPYQRPEQYNATSPHDEPDTVRRIEGLPPLRSDPFADDPFRDGGGSEASYNRGLRAPDEDPYYRGSSPLRVPGDDHLPPYEEQPYNTSHHDPDHYNDHDLPQYNDYVDNPEDYPSEQPYYPETREDVNRLQAPAHNDYNYSDGRRTPSDSGRPGFPKWRNPDLQEVIDYLLDEDDDVKAHAAAYLQHLCFMDDDMKAKTRGLGGIQPLVKLLSNDFPEVHRNACGALQNLSYGKANNENKKAIRAYNGIPELIRLLRKTQDEDVKESVTGILWNLSSCEDLKMPIIDDGLAVLVNVVIIPGSGYDRVGSTPYQDHEPWTTVFRNGTGVIRNVSSAGYESRKRLRECRGLVNSLIHTLKQAADSMDLDNKPIENVVCTLRNLSYRIQEVQDRDFYKKRYNTLQRMSRDTDKGENSGCFGGGAGKKKGQQKGDNKSSPAQNTVNMNTKLPTIASEYKALWGIEVIQKYLILIKNTSNPITLEGGAGAIQNLVACDWAPAVEIRGHVRKEKGLPHLVDLLAFENDRVVCAAATALRNLAIDDRNKELVGKYAMRQLVSKLPQDTRHSELVPPDDTLCAVIATLYEVVKTNQDFASSFLEEKGVARLMSITMSEGKYLARTIKYASTVLRTMWQFKALHNQYARLGHKESNFLSASAIPRAEGKSYHQTSMSTLKSPGSSNHTTPYNTLSRPISAQGYDDNTLSRGPMYKRPPPNDNSFYNDGYNSMTNSNSARIGQPGDIPMSDLGPSPGYGTIDEPRQRSKTPVGGVPLFPNLPPSSSPTDGRHNYSTNPEPLYAQVNKGNRRRQDDYSHSNELMLEADGGGGGAVGADSWV